MSEAMPIVTFYLTCPHCRYRDAVLSNSQAHLCPPSGGFYLNCGKCGHFEHTRRERMEKPRPVGGAGIAWREDGCYE